MCAIKFRQVCHKVVNLKVIEVNIRATATHAHVISKRVFTSIRRQSIVVHMQVCMCERLGA